MPIGRIHAHGHAPDFNDEAETFDFGGKLWQGTSRLPNVNLATLEFVTIDDDHAVHTHNHPGGECRSANQSRDGAFRKSQDCELGSMHFPFRRMKETFPSSCSQKQENLWPASHRRGSKSANPRLAVLRHHAMSKETPIAAEQHDVSFGNGSLLKCPLNHERIPRPNRGQHAPTHDLQAQRPRRAQHFARQLALQALRVARILGQQAS